MKNKFKVGFDYNGKICIILNPFVIKLDRLNKGENSVFPYNSYTVCIYPNDHPQPHVHIFPKNGNPVVKVNILTNEIIEISPNNYNKSAYKKIRKNIKKWFDEKINFDGMTNRDNAKEMWAILHTGRIQNKIKDEIKKSRL